MTKVVKFAVSEEVRKMRLWLAWILLILGFVVFIPTSLGGRQALFAGIRCPL